jgi:hypothetical protein
MIERQCERLETSTLQTNPHKIFVNIYETYLFKGKSFAIVEYVGLSLEELLQNPFVSWGLR